MSKPRKIGYARVSSSSDEQQIALEQNQLPRLRAQNPDRIIVDIGSGRDKNRPGYVELLNLIDRKGVDEVIVTRRDRLGRDMKESLFFSSLVKARKVTVTCLDGGYVSGDSPSDFLVDSMTAMLSEYESRMLSLRITRGWEERRRVNKPARGRVPWGYRYVEGNAGLELDPIDGAKAAAMVKILHDCDWRFHTALRVYQQTYGELPLNSVQALKVWVSNPVLRGGLGYFFDGAPKKKPEKDNRIKETAEKRAYTYKFQKVVWNQHAPLISPDEWRQIEGRLSSNRKMWGRNAKAAPRLLTGLCVCALCKKRMSYRSGKWVPALLCYTLDCPRRYKSFREQTIVDAINAALSRRAVDLANLCGTESSEVLELRAAIAEAEAKGDPDYAPTIEVKRERLKALLPLSTIDPEFVDALKDPLVWTHMDSETLRRTYEELLLRVEVSDPQTVQVFCRF